MNNHSEFCDSAASPCRKVSLWPIACLTLFALFLSPFSVELALGQENASLKVSKPSAGSAPTPGSARAHDSNAVHASDSVDENQLPNTVVLVQTTETDDGHKTDETDGLPTQSSDVGAPESEVQSEVDSTDSMNLEDLVEEAFAQPGEVNTSSGGEPVQLSVQPGTQPVLPVDRPAWIGADPDYSSDVHRIYVASTAVSDPEDADSALDAPLLAALRTYTDEQILKQHQASDDLDLTSDFIRKNMVVADSSVVLKLNTGSEPMYQKWVTVEVTPEQRALLHQWHRESIQVQRLAPLGLGLAAILGFVGAGHLLFRRKHGLATSQPLSSDAFVAVNSPNIGKHRGIGLFGILGMLFLFGFAAFALLGFLYVGLKTESHREYQEAVRGQEEAVARAPEAKSHEEWSDETTLVRSTSDGFHAEATAHSSGDASYGQEFVIETGGQKIRVKKYK